ncbi:hypothetical protein CDAR_486041 [Caerostris darwini]|uniref:Uncharacterized protein n=1 Tax=Caerostris darwini TaxID=1538125 RepID=A0AAV4WJH6_9ARAC|nr:hypothetical protein CDAR_486041 [Caerostris darwini]
MPADRNCPKWVTLFCRPRHRKRAAAPFHDQQNREQVFETRILSIHILWREYLRRVLRRSVPLGVSIHLIHRSEVETMIMINVHVQCSQLIVQEKSK